MDLLGHLYDRVLLIGVGALVGVAVVLAAIQRKEQLFFLVVFERHGLVRDLFRRVIRLR